jgi:fructose-1,6-bisphosphatase/inositol monophosphatase family enzyme
VSRLDAAVLLPIVRTFHEDVRRRVAALLDEARHSDRPDLASRPGEWGAGDLGYALDDAAELALEAFGAALSRHGPAVIVAEGPGERRHAGSAGPGVLALVDPVDGTRPLMQELRSAWVLTGLAPDGGAATRLSDIEFAVQTELPLSTAAVYHVAVAQRGGGATLARHDVLTGEELDLRPLRVHGQLPLDNGSFSFTHYLPAERVLVAELAQRFLGSAIATHGIDPHLVYDDQYLCSSGQLFLVTTGRYRMLADLRAWLGTVHGIKTFTAKPYDLAALLVYEEAGVSVLDAAGRPLDAPCDTETRLDVVAFGNERLRQAYWPLLEQLLKDS